MKNLIQAIRVYSQYIGMELSIEKCAMLIMKSRKRETVKMNKTTKSGRNQNAWKQGKLQVPRNIESGHNQTEMKGGKNQRVPKKRKKTPPNQTLQQKSHQRNRHLDSTPFKILRTILKKDPRGTLTNGSKDKEINDSEQGFMTERWHRWYVSRNGGRGHNSTEDYIDVSRQGFKKGFKKSKERLITATSNSSDNIRWNSMDTSSDKLPQLCSRREKETSREKLNLF